MLRWIFCLLTAVAAGAIQRPDAKATLRGLARLPKLETRVSLDFDAARGFVALRTDNDPAAALAELRAKVNPAVNNSRLLLEIAEARMDTGDLAGARRDMQRAADALRKTVDAEPGNARARLDLANALHGLARPAEAEAIFRELVKAAPRSATNWLAFSLFLEARGWEIAGSVFNWKGRRPNGELCLAVMRMGASTETADRAGRYFDESVGAAKTAVEIDEESAAAQHRLAVAMAGAECFAALRARMRAGESSRPGVEMLIFSAKALPGFERAAELEPENPGRLATALLWRGLSDAADMQMTIGELSRRPVWDLLPEESRRAIGSGLARLESFNDSALAGKALQARGLLRLLFRNDVQGAVEDLQNAAAEIPESEQLWETLSTALMRKQDYFELAAVAEARALVRPNLRNRLLLAKAHERLGNLDRAEEEITTALALSAADFTANIALANLLLKKSSDDFISPRIRSSLINAERAVRGSSNGQQLVDLAVAQSIYYGVIDDFDRARAILKAALDYSKNNPDVMAALNAIGY